MKKSGIILVAIFATILIADISGGIVGHYRYSKYYDSFWSLSVKASSITKKKESLDRFIYALERSSLRGQHDALFMETADNDFDQNLEALKSLQIRLHEISTMDVSSFQYQTALAQITQQEQNEAKDMLSVFRGCWWKENYLFLWSWIGASQIALAIILLIVGLAMWILED